MEEGAEAMKEALLTRNKRGQLCVDGGDDRRYLGKRVWAESKMLWRVAGPAIFGRVVTYSMNVITQAFAGHLGDLQLASMSIANTVVVGFNFGLLLGMASALETLCGQAFGAKKYHMLGIYMQRSWIVLFACATLILPTYFFAASILELAGQPPELAAQAGMVSVWFIPLHYSFVFVFPLQRFLQCQLKNSVNAIAAAIALAIHLLVTWLFVYHYKFGLFGTAMTLNFSWWVAVALLMCYVYCGGCPETWNGLSMEAFSGLWEFLKLSTSSGVMLCLENWYYRILIVLAGNLKNAEIAVDALSICMSINGWELMIPLAFFAATGVRVANELGAGNSNGAKFATIVAVITSSIIGVFFVVLILALHDKFAYIFTQSRAVINAVDKLSLLLAFTILLNSVQPVLSGVAVGSGWQSAVAYVNIASYYLIGLPVGVLMGWFFRLGVLGIWAGMIGGTVVQTLILTMMTVRCDWDKEALEAASRMDRWSSIQK
ncbi:Protein TRANSPARENT TESTA 12 [Platanthera zijinensis]|uniref:Protein DETOXIFICATION n=1 Tax=Platanthera zijinensis TaxID=2320716 RepID=A0AAP0BID7_9ASPA